MWRPISRGWIESPFFAVMLKRFGGHGLYVLDEPEAALSPNRQLALLARMHELVRKKSQFIIATHSPMLMAYPDAWIYRITDDGLRHIEYRQTDHYAVMKRFLNDPEGQLKALLDP